MAVKLPAETDFLTGVVEGFYGRPWTYPQRKELFRRMNHMGMNSYLYAPKDDIKHRQSWRDLYTSDEEQQLQSLISESTECGILFIFALSPGLDVTFSSAKEVDVLKKKVDQVSKLGCRAFALLFDDIEPRLCPADREVFSSSARAQVVFANDLYNYLGCPNIFLFCPTEYCSSLAAPSISKSEYLSTVASYLAPGIAVIWTGSLVVSKNIHAAEVQELSELLKHPIVLWDNLHANDYDQRRVFIGPYSGRPLELRRNGLIRGVLTNPNCEFEANFVALHTLSQWSRYGQFKCSLPDNKTIEPDGNHSGSNSTEKCLPSGEAILSSEDGLNQSSSNNRSSYQPREALMVALRDWLTLMLQDQQMSHAPSKASTAVGTPIPMETDSTDYQSSAETEMHVEPNANSSAPFLRSLVPDEMNLSVDVTLEDLELLADLFYLPFSHGPAAVRLLELGHWLREHSHECGPNPCDPEKNLEWINKLSEFAEMVSSVARLRDHIQRLPSKSIAYELAPYVTEVHTVLGMILDYFRWLETGVMAYRSMSHLRRLLTWFSPGYRDMITSGDQEPWTFRGGLITELHRILPLESAQDLFPAPSRAVPGTTTIPNLAWPDLSAAAGLPHPVPFIPVQPNASSGRSVRSHAYVVRPYQTEDKAALYSLFRRLLLARVGLPESALPVELADLPGDRYLLHFLEHSPENCFVVEGPSFLSSTCIPGAFEERKCVGFGLSSANALALARDRTTRYRDVLCVKYPKNLIVQSYGPASSVGEFPTSSKIADHAASDTSSRVPLAAATEHTTGFPCSKVPMTIDEFIKFLLHPFHADTTEVADIVDAAAVLPPPEPLGAALPSEPVLSGCLDPLDMNSGRGGIVEPPNVPIEMPPPAFPNERPPDSLPALVPSIVPDTAPPSPPSAVQTPMPVAPVGSCSSSPITPAVGFVRPVLVAGGPEALHTALTAHPATLWVEFDDLEIGSWAVLPTPAMLMNHNLGISTDPPDFVFDLVARRMFICLLASLKTIGAHGSHVQLDAVNEHRAEMYRRFGFYPVPAASTEQTTILARLI